MTGSIGAATAGLACLLQPPGDDATGADDLAGCIERYRRPEPRVRLGMLLGRNRAVRAAVDLSDGLGDGLRQLAQASSVGAVIDETAVPIDAGARRWFEAQGVASVDAAVAGGDDYELLVAVSRQQRRRFAAVGRLARGVPLTRIGVLTSDSDLVLRDGTSERPIPSGYQHFTNT